VMSAGNRGSGDSVPMMQMKIVTFDSGNGL
jgi:hypothetical protein